MQISMNIVFESAEEFASWAQTIGLVGEAKVTSHGPEPTLALETTKEATAPKRRKRRTKGEIAADLEAKTAAADAAVVVAAAISAPGEAADVAHSAAPATGPEPTIENTVAILRAYINKNGSDAVIAKLQEYGVERVNEIASDKLVAFLTELVNAA